VTFRLAEGHFEPTEAQIDAAQRRVAPYAIRTAILTSETLDRMVKGRVFLKPENLQRSGSLRRRLSPPFSQAKLTRQASAWAS